MKDLPAIRLAFITHHEDYELPILEMPPFRGRRELKLDLSGGGELTASANLQKKGRQFLKD